MLFSLQPTTFQKILPFIVLYFVYFLGQLLDVLEVDSAQYAAISWEMATTGEWLEVKQRGVDYLDKPPLLFWVTSLAFNVFGINNFTFRLLPILASLGGAYSTYRLAKLYYNEQTAYLAALLLASCQAIFLMNHDLRTDNLLTSVLAFALWHLAAYLKSQRWVNLIWGFIGVGFAMLAKGPLGLMIPVFTFSLDVLIKRQWKLIFNWHYLVGLFILIIILLPMSIGLYQQFDLHPEKQVNGLTGVSGLRFYYWTQSFGRITGENVWNNNPDPFFLVHTTLWSFLPWTVFLLIAYWKETVLIFKNKWTKLSENEEIFLWSGFTLTFLALSQSKYQLNHYIYPIYPLGAILTAKWVDKLLRTDFPKQYKLLQIIQIFILIIFVLLSLFLLYCFPISLSNTWVVAIWAFLFFSAFYYLAKPQYRLQELILPYFLAILAMNFLLNGWIYPSLFAYQTESVAIKKLKDNNPEAIGKLYLMGENVMVNSSDFYAQRTVPFLDSATQLPKGEVWVYCSENKLPEFQKSHIEVVTKEQYDDYHISELSLPFLLPSQRNQTVRKMYLVKLFVK